MLENQIYIFFGNYRALSNYLGNLTLYKFASKKDAIIKVSTRSHVRDKKVPVKECKLS